MQQTPFGKLVSPTDLVNFLAECKHITNSDMQRSAGYFDAPPRADVRNDHFVRMGLSHEAEYLQNLKNQGKTVVEISGVRDDANSLRQGAELTKQAMADGVDVVYQATFLRPPWTGHADFLIKADHGGYEVVDAKLAREPRPSAIMQIAAYSAEVARIQGRQPEQMHILGGNNALRSFAVADFADLHALNVERFEEHLENPQKTMPEPVEACNWCQFLSMCDTQWRLDDDLSQLSGLTRSFKRQLIGAGVPTVAALADADPQSQIPGVNPDTLWLQRHQARLQMQKRETGAPQLEFFAPRKANTGFALLPEPHPKDVRWDLEGSQEAREGGRAYIWGWEREGLDGELRYQHMWGIHLGRRAPGGLSAEDIAADDAAERRAFETFIDYAASRNARFPGMHFYNYGNYDVKDMLRRLAIRYDTRQDVLRSLIRDGVFVDGLAVSTGSMLTSEGHSLKALEAFHPMVRSGPITDAAGSMVLFHQYLQTGDRRILAQIKAYNRDDVVSLRLLGQLHEFGRQALIDLGHDIPRLVVQLRVRSEASIERDAEFADTRARLLRGVPLVEAERTAEQQGVWLLAQLLDFHREEFSAEMLDHRRRLELGPEELVAEVGAIAGLQLIDETPEPYLNSLIHRYQFDPDQEYRIKVGDAVIDPATGKGAGEVLAVDEVDGVLSLKRGKRSDVPHPAAVLEPEPINMLPLRVGLLNMAKSVLVTGVDGSGPYRAGRDLLLRRSAAVDNIPAGLELAARSSAPSDALRRLLPKLAETCLVGQGPPGTGKTTAAAKGVVDLLQKGERLALTGPSHKAITELLEAVVKEASARGVPINAVQKARTTEGSSNEAVLVTDSNDKVIKALATGDVNLLAGTPWLLCNEKVMAAARLRGATVEPGLVSDARQTPPFNLLVADEGAKMALADVLAMGAVADNILVLGDQRQLRRPTKGTHAPGVDVSAMAHYVGGPTVHPTQGILLDKTYRMSPDITKFVSRTFYSRRLRSAQANAQQVIKHDDALGGSGIRFVALSSADIREASGAALQRIYGSLLGRVWVGSDGEPHVVGPEDIAVMASRNSDVTAARVAIKRLDGDIGAKAVNWIGTVDSMQSREAAVSIFMIGSPQDGHRTLARDLTDARLNVAVTRAKVLSIVVGSPEWLIEPTISIQDMVNLNALCSYVRSSVTLNADLQEAALPALTFDPPPGVPLIGVPAPARLARSVSPVAPTKPGPTFSI